MGFHFIVQSVPQIHNQGQKAWFKGLNTCTVYQAKGKLQTTKYKLTTIKANNKASSDK